MSWRVRAHRSRCRLLWPLHRLWERSRPTVWGVALGVLAAVAASSGGDHPLRG